jgi:hypothetical protein
MSETPPRRPFWSVPHEVGPVSPPTAGMLQQQISDINDKAEEGHHRLRKDLDLLSDRVSDLTGMVEAHRAEVRAYRTTPTNITNISFSANQLVAIVVASLALAGGFYTISERQSQTNEAIERMQKMQELQRIQLESLTKTVLTQGRKE